MPQPHKHTGTTRCFMNVLHKLSRSLQHLLLACFSSACPNLSSSPLARRVCKARSRSWRAKALVFVFPLAARLSSFALAHCSRLGYPKRLLGLANRGLDLLEAWRARARHEQARIKKDRVVACLSDTSRSLCLLSFGKQRARRRGHRLLRGVAG